MGHKVSLPSIWSTWCYATLRHKYPLLFGSIAPHTQAPPQYPKSKYIVTSGVTTIGAGRAVAPPIFDGAKIKKLEINYRMANYSTQRQYSLRLQ